MPYYNLSKDYNKLYRFLVHIPDLDETTQICAFVDHVWHGEDMPPSRDICKIIRFSEWDIQFQARGVGYGSVKEWKRSKAMLSERESFIEECKSLNLEWIVSPVQYRRIKGAIQLKEIVLRNGKEIPFRSWFVKFDLDKSSSIKNKTHQIYMQQGLQYGSVGDFSEDISHEELFELEQLGMIKLL